jgi:TetR/AcrR family transcriptional regulator, transcriptional repressor of aconitase
MMGCSLARSPILHNMCYVISMTHDHNLTRSTSRRVDDSEAERVARRGRPAGDHEAKRAELLTAAISVIAQEGYAGTSLRKVAQHAGCTTGAVTYYFANKEAMITAVTQSLFDEFDTLLEASQDRIDIKAILEQWLDRTNANDSDLWLVLFQLLAHARYEPAFAAVIQRRYARFRHMFTSILARGQSQGTIRSDISADLLADQLSAISDGWMMMFPIEPERFKPGRVQALLDAAITMITPPPTAGGKTGSRGKRQCSGSS